MSRLRRSVDRILERVLVAIMAVMVLNVVWQVFTRFVLRNPSSYTEELARYLLIWLGLLGASYCVGRRLHLTVDVLSAGWTGSKRLLVDLFVSLCVLLFALFVMVIGGARLVVVTLAFRQTSAALQIDLGYVYLALPLSGLLMIFYCAEELGEGLKQVRGVP
jgi:TRAP-type C4-dicarboxylate transport system permease small subunit